MEIRRDEPLLAKMSDKGSEDWGFGSGGAASRPSSGEESFTPGSRFREDGRPVGSGGGEGIPVTP